MRIERSEVVILSDRERGKGTGDWNYLPATAFLRLHTDEGLIGLSEVAGVPAAVARAALEGADSWLGGQLVGQDPVPPEALWRRLYEAMVSSGRRGWLMGCLGAVDVAAWDLYGQALGRPVHELLGGAPTPSERTPHARSSDEVVPYGTICADTWDRAGMLRQELGMLETLRGMGYRAFKVEPLWQRPETVVELAALARRALGDGPILAVDVGYGWDDVATAIGVCRRLAEHDVYFLETPFPTEALEAHARLAADSPVPIAAGENATTRGELLELVDRGGAAVLLPYVTLCGGLTEARRIAELARSRGARVVPGGWTTSVHAAATAHFAAVSAATPVYEVAPAELYASPLRRAIQEEAGLPIAGGTVRLPRGPGIGVSLPARLIERYWVG